MSTYNNFYEFGTDKSIYRAAQRMPVSPWTIKIEGMVEKPATLGLDDLLKQVQLEERDLPAPLRRGLGDGRALDRVPDARAPPHRRADCAAKYVEMETWPTRSRCQDCGCRSSTGPTSRGCGWTRQTTSSRSSRPGCTARRCRNRTARRSAWWCRGSTGSSRSSRSCGLNFTDKQPLNSWQRTQPAEYGFWANVNPAVPHPRWSQATERLLASDERVPTQIYNGYGAQVASLYAGMPVDKLFM